MVAAIVEVEDGVDGREAADRLANDWENRDWVPASPSPAWARAAVIRFGEIMAEQPSIFQASMRRADKGASTLSPRPFQGILECLQNADDLGARHLRVAFRNRGRPELLIAHDGEPVTLANVGAMMIPWLSTKDGDADAAGRFGIGQRTLNALGGPIELHASPFHLVMGTDGPRPCDPESDVPGVYDGSRRDTMLVIPLSPKVTSEAIAVAVGELSAESLIFLTSVRELTYGDLEDPACNLRFAVEVEHVHKGSVDFDGRSTDVAVHDVRVVAGATSGLAPSFRRYSTGRPVPDGEARANKETGASTPLGICAPLTGGRPRGLYDRMPLPMSTGLLIGLNAQFDPDAARSTLIPNDWNLARIKDLGRLVGWAALDAFARETAIGWTHVPLASEAGGEDDWVDAAVREHVVDTCRLLLQKELALEVGGEAVDLGQLAFESEGLERLLTEGDVETIAPDAVALPRSARDPAGRWRQVLEELGGPEEIGAEEALGIIDGDPSRGIDWHVAFAALAHREGLQRPFLARPGIMLADGTLSPGPRANEPWVLVKEASLTALAPRLGIARRLHAEYVRAGSPTAQFVAYLEQAGALYPNRDDPADVFAIIDRGDWNSSDAEPIRLGNEDLLALRDGWSQLPRERRQGLGTRIGRSVAIRSTWIDDKGARQRGWDRPADLYLPVAIDREVDSFAKAADRTPGLRWVDGDYAKVLKQAAGRAAIGAQKLLSAWGVAREPRLVKPADEATRWARDTTAASPVVSDMRTADHLAAIRSVANYTHLIDDHWSPDADAVAADIARAPVKSRRKRALAFLSVLSRNWDKRYSDLSTARAAVAYAGWNIGAEVRATWLARLANIRWLPDAGNGYQRPADLQLQVPGSPPRPSDRSSTIAKVDPQILRTGVLTALGVKAGPSQRDLIERLRSLRSTPVTAAVTEEVLDTYQLLAASLRDRSDAAPDERMPPAKLRNAFRASPNETGLLLIDGMWLSPESARRGPPVLGHRRPFAPHVEGLEPLWKALNIEPPSAGDAIAVLKEIASGSPSEVDQGIAIRAFSIIADALPTMTAQLRSTLRRLPLWTGTAWTAVRPLHALDGDALLHTAPADLPVWRPGITSFSPIAALLEPLGVIHLTSADFRAISFPTYGVAEGEALRPTFARAMALLRQELVRADQRLLDALSVDWDELAAASVLIDPELSITAQLGSGSLTLPARAHVTREPLSLIVRDATDAASAEGAGAAIAALFEGDRQKAAWAWAAIWPRAVAGEQAEGAVLPKTRAERGKGSERLSKLAQQAAKRTGSKKETSKSTATNDKKKEQQVQIRKLKDPSTLKPSAGVIVNEGASATGNPVINQRRVKQKPRRFSPGQNGGGGPASPRTVLPPTSDRERIALDAVRIALALDVEQFNDLRAERGVGVDAIDELRQCYEIKMCSGSAMPADVTLTASEIVAARDDPDFFLAIVTGLEEGAGKLRVRFIFDPLRQLDVRVRTDLTLTGVDKAEALEFEFEATSIEEAD